MLSPSGHDSTPNGRRVVARSPRRTQDLNSPAMGGYSASSHDVDFPYGTALQAARDLYKLSGEVKEKHRQRVTEKDKAVDSWVGGHRDTFNTKMGHEDTDVTSVSEGLVTLTTNIAKAWAQAWGEQDRINFARY